MGKCAGVAYLLHMHLEGTGTDFFLSSVFDILMIALRASVS